MTTDGRRKTAARTDRPVPGGGSGRAQLTIVEHALCPLDTGSSLAEGLAHRSEFFYLDENRHQRKATARCNGRLPCAPLMVLPSGMTRI